MGPTNFYQLLGLDATATAEEISSAYRKLVRQHHPDLNTAPDAHDLMAALNEAYAVLSDPAKRGAYDARSDFTSFEPIVPTRGPDHHATVALDIEDAYGDADRQVTLRYTGANAQAAAVQLQIKVPRGVVEGPNLRLPGLGGAGTGGGPAGDLLLEVQFKPDPRWRAEGRDVYQRLPVAPWEAALGGSILVATPGGEVEVQLPPAVSAGSVVRLKGLGIPAAVADGTPGDLYLELDLALPSADDAVADGAAQAAYAAMAQAFPRFNPREALGAAS